MISGGRVIRTDQKSVIGMRLKRSRNAALLALLLLFPLPLMIQQTHDAAWQMWISRQLLHGADLYTDIIEINPPLWFWLGIPLAGLSELTGIYSVYVLVVAFLVAIAGSIMLSARALPEWSEPRRFIFFAALLAAVMPPANFGQREHFTLITAIPYVLLIGRRYAGAEVPRTLAAGIGVFAAVGFALKPHFALVPVALELWLWMGTRRLVARPEIIAVVVCGAVYALSIIFLEPDYLSKSVPLTLRGYGELGQMQFAEVLPSLIPLIMALFLVPLRGGLPAAFMVASLTFYVTFVIQAKGFAYQVIPAMGMLVLALASTVTARSAIRDGVAIATAVLAIMPNLSPYRTRPWADVPRGSSYAALSIAPRAGWPLVEERGLKWPLRSMSLWMAPALGTELRPALVNDIECNTPNFLLVDDRRYSFSNLVPDILTHYSPIYQRSGLKLMRLERPFDRPSTCRKIH